MALDTWDPRAAAAGSPIGYPALTSPYPQSGVAAYTDPVTRPVPTLASITPNTIDDAVAVITLIAAVGTLFTNATHFSFGGVIDSPRILSVQYISPTSVKLTINPIGLAPGTYNVFAINQDGGTSTPAVVYTVT
jgi:hypothetical protein